MNEERTRQLITELLLEVGENPDRDGLKDTPDRMVRMFKEIFRGYDQSQAPKITTFPNGQDGLRFSDMVVDSGNYYSLCEHHCRTFFGTYHFAYIPNPQGLILGISKVGRVVDYCASRLQVQERLCGDIVSMLENALTADNHPAPLGMAIVMTGRHMCKESRGSRKQGEMTSTYYTGVFKDNPEIRNEFLKQIK